jgi:outer membrane phospholipase A
MLPIAAQLAAISFTGSSRASLRLLPRLLLRSRLRVLLGAALCASLCVAAVDAHAEIALLQPAPQAAGNEPLQLTVLYSNDNAQPLDVEVPATLDFMVSTGDAPPSRLTLHRATAGSGAVPQRLHLRRGQFRKVSFSAPWPEDLRGTVRIASVQLQAAPVLVTLNRGSRQDVVAAQQRAAAQASTPSPASGAAPSGAAPAPALATAAAAPAEGRLSFYEPMYIADGINGHQSARFQLSLKYRLLVPDDPASKRFLDNLYFGYTQTSIWDLTADSKPFRDTSYRPTLFYYLADTGLRSNWFSRVGIQTGLEHESNGQGGAASRSINTAYVKPIITFGAPDANQLTIAPKAYYYLQYDDNPDIARYRGYVDLMIKYGRADGLELATTLRKGNHGWYGSIDTALTYPLSKLLGSKWGGFVYAGYFNGYGEDILDYNQRQHWIARIGYSISR